MFPLYCNVVNGCAYKVLGKDLCTKEVDVYSVLAWIISITDMKQQKKYTIVSGRTGRAIVQIPNLPLYNILRIRFINRLVWESTEIELFKMGRICLWRIHICGSCYILSDNLLLRGLWIYILLPIRLITFQP